jgi:preprotein translocase subunit SecG
MRRTVHATLLSLALLAATAPVALASEIGHDGGEGLWGETNDKVITNAGFFLIAFFPLFVLVMSLLQWRLDKRKERRKAAEKARRARADLRGGW